MYDINTFEDKLKSMTDFEEWRLFWAAHDKNVAIPIKTHPDAFCVFSWKGHQQFILFGKVKSWTWRGRRKRRLQIGLVVLDPRADFLEDQLAVRVEKMKAEDLLDSNILASFSQLDLFDTWVSESKSAATLEVFAKILRGLTRSEWKKKIERWKVLSVRGTSVPTILGGAPGLQQQK